MGRDGEHTDEEDGDELEIRIKAPVQWMKYDSLRIEDLQEKRYEEALSLIKEHYINFEPTFKSINLIEDPESVEEFLMTTKTQMKDKASIVAIDESCNKVIGVLIQRVIYREGFSRTLSKVKLTKGKEYSMVKKFYNTLEKPVNVHETYQAKEYLKIYVLAIHPSYRGQGLGINMYECAIKSAKSFNINIVVTIITSYQFQKKIIELLGFQKVNELFYTKYEDNNKIIFNAIGSGNYGAAFVIKIISDF